MKLITISQDWSKIIVVCLSQKDLVFESQSWKKQWACPSVVSSPPPIYLIWVDRIDLSIFYSKWELSNCEGGLGRCWKESLHFCWIFYNVVKRTILRRRFLPNKRVELFNNWSKSSRNKSCDWMNEKVKTGQQFTKRIPRNWQHGKIAQL